MKINPRYRLVIGNDCNAQLAAEFLNSISVLGLSRWLSIEFDARMDYGKLRDIFAKLYQGRGVYEGRNFPHVILSRKMLSDNIHLAKTLLANVPSNIKVLLPSDMESVTEAALSTIFNADVIQQNRIINLQLEPGLSVEFQMRLKEAIAKSQRSINVEQLMSPMANFFNAAIVQLQVPVYFHDGMLDIEGVYPFTPAEEEPQHPLEHKSDSGRLLKPLWRNMKGGPLWVKERKCLLFDDPAPCSLEQIKWVTNILAEKLSLLPAIYVRFTFGPNCDAIAAANFLKEFCQVRAQHNVGFMKLVIEFDIYMISEKLVKIFEEFYGPKVPRNSAFPTVFLTSEMVTHRVNFAQGLMARVPLAGKIMIEKNIHIVVVDNLRHALSRVQADVELFLEPGAGAWVAPRVEQALARLPQPLKFNFRGEADAVRPFGAARVSNSVAASSSSISFSNSSSSSSSSSSSGSSMSSAVMPSSSSSASSPPLSSPAIVFASAAASGSNISAAASRRLREKICGCTMVNEASATRCLNCGAHLY